VMVNVLRVLVFVFIFILLLYLSLLILFVISLGISVLFRVICPHQPSSAPFPSHFVICRPHTNGPHVSLNDHTHDLHSFPHFLCSSCILEYITQSIVSTLQSISFSLLPLSSVCRHTLCYTHSSMNHCPIPVTHWHTI